MAMFIHIVTVTFPYLNILTAMVIAQVVFEESICGHYMSMSAGVILPSADVL